MTSEQLIKILSKYPGCEVCMTTTGIDYDDHSNLAICEPDGMRRELLVISMHDGQGFIPKQWWDGKVVQEHSTWTLD